MTKKTSRTKRRSAADWPEWPLSIESSKDQVAIGKELVRIVGYFYRKILEANPPELPDDEAFDLAGRFKKYGALAFWQPAFWVRFAEAQQFASEDFREYFKAADEVFEGGAPRPEPDQTATAERVHRQRISEAKKELEAFFGAIVPLSNTRGRPSGKRNSSLVHLFREEKVGQKEREIAARTRQPYGSTKKAIAAVAEGEGKSPHTVRKSLARLSAAKRRRK